MSEGGEDGRAGRRGLWRVAALALGLVAAMGVTLLSAEEMLGTFTGRVLGTRVAFERGGDPRSAWAGTLGFRLDSGEDLVVFCIQLDVGVGAGNRYRTGGPLESLPGGCQLRYILDRYPGSSAHSEEEAAARQMAIWHFSDGVDLTTITNTQAALRDRAMAIAQEAETGPCPARRTAKPDLEIEPQVARGHAGRRVTYRVTSSAFDAGQPISVTVTGPAVLDNGAAFMVAVLDGVGATDVGVTGTGVGTTSLAVQLPYRLDAGIVLSQIDDSRPSQRLVMAQHLDFVAEAVAGAVWDEAPTATATIPSPTATQAPATATAVVPTATGTETVAATLTPTPTPWATTTAPATRRATDVPAATPGVGDQPHLPSALPRTGGGGRAPWLPAGVVCVAMALVLRRLAAGPRRVGG